MPGRMKFEELIIESSSVEMWIEETRLKKYTGYLQIEFRHFKFLLFIEEGIPTHGFRVIEDQLFSFSSLAAVLHSLEGGCMRFYETPPGFLHALLDIKFGDQIYGTLYTTFCDLGKLFRTLEQKAHTGSVDIDLPSAHCFVVMEKGTPCEIVCVPENREEETGTEESRKKMGTEVDTKTEAKTGTRITNKELYTQKMLKLILDEAVSENGIVKVFERRNPLTIFSPDPDEMCFWSNPRRLKLEFAFGQLGKEFEKLLDKRLTISQILDTLCVDFVEIAEIFTYLSAKGYIAREKVT